MTIAKKEVSAGFMVVPGRFAVQGENGLTGGLGERVNLGVAHEGFAGISWAAAHVVGIRDLSVGDGFTARDGLVLAAGADEQVGVRIVFGYQQIEHFFGGLSARFVRESIVMFVGVDLQGNVEFFEVLPAQELLRLRLIIRTTPPVKDKEQQNDGDDKKELQQAGTGLRVGAQNPFPA